MNFTTLIAFIIGNVILCSADHTILHVGGSTTDCGKSEVITVGEDDYKIEWHGDSFPTYCNFTFKAQDTEHEICVKQEKFNIEDCDVYLQYFVKKTDDNGTSHLVDKSDTFACNHYLKKNKHHEFCGEYGQFLTVSFIDKQTQGSGITTTRTMIGGSYVNLEVYQHKDFPVWAIVLICVGSFLVVAVGVSVVVMVSIKVCNKNHNKRKTNRTAPYVGQQQSHWTFQQNPPSYGQTQYGTQNPLQYGQTQYGIQNPVTYGQNQYGIQNPPTYDQTQYGAQYGVSLQDDQPKKF